MTPITSEIMIAKRKLNELRATANLVPNSSLSRGNVTKPTIVKVVKNETATTILIPASTREPTNGNATNAGIRVILPTNAETIVDISVFDLAAISLIVSGGKNVNMSPIKNKIPMI